MTTWNDGDIQSLLALELEIRMREARRAALVDHLREQGCPWSVIGEALGTSKQAAHKKYGPRSTPEAVSPLDVPLPIGED